MHDACMPTGTVSHTYVCIRKHAPYTYPVYIHAYARVHAHMHDMHTYVPTLKVCFCLFLDVGQKTWKDGITFICGCSHPVPKVKPPAGGAVSWKGLAQVAPACSFAGGLTYV